MPEPMKEYKTKRKKSRPTPTEPGQSMNFRMWIEYKYDSATVLCQKCGVLVAMLWRGSQQDVLPVLEQHRCKEKGEMISLLYP